MKIFGIHWMKIVTFNVKIMIAGVKLTTVFVICVIAIAYVKAVLVCN